MGTNHKIKVDFARSIRRVVDVKVYQSWRDFIPSEQFVIHGPKHSGSIRSELLIAGVITFIILIVIAMTIMLVL